MTENWLWFTAGWLSGTIGGLIGTWLLLRRYKTGELRGEG